MTDTRGEGDEQSHPDAVSKDRREKLDRCPHARRIETLCVAGIAEMHVIVAVVDTCQPVSSVYGTRARSRAPA